jgi:hypothetical protein
MDEFEKAIAIDLLVAVKQEREAYFTSEKLHAFALEKDVPHEKIEFLLGLLEDMGLVKPVHVQGPSRIFKGYRITVKGDDYVWEKSKGFFA